MDKINKDPRTRGTWIPILVGLLLCIIVAFLWWALNEREKINLQEKMREEALEFISFIDADLRGRIPAVQRIVIRWENRGGIPREIFESDAQSHINDFPGFQALKWVDRDFNVQWIVPPAGNEQSLGMNLAFDEERRIALETAGESRIPTMTSPIDLIQGGKGFLVYFPIKSSGEFDGFVLAVFRIQEWLEYVYELNVTQEQSEQFLFSVSMDDELMYKSSDWNTLENQPFQFSSGIHVLGHHFSLSIHPSMSFIKENSSILPEVAAAIGVLLSLLISVVVHLYQRASKEIWRTQSIASSLKMEIVKHQKTEIELNKTSDRLELATKAGNIGVWSWDIESGELNWNRIMFELYNVPPDVIPKYETWHQAILPEDQAETEKLLEMAIDGKAVFDTEFRVIRPENEFRNMRAAARVERDPAGKALRMTGVNWDITARKRSEEELATQKRRLSDILEGTNVGTWEWNVQTGEVIFNERWAEIVGHTLKEISPVSIDTWTGFAHPDDLEVSRRNLENHFNGKVDYYETEARMLHKSGDWIWVLERGKVSSWTEDDKPLFMSGTHQDITERKMAEERIQHMATHDALTGLPSLHLVKDRIKNAVGLAHRYKKQAAVMFVDLDGFKTINDTYGHDAGDALLKEVALRLRSCLRETDTAARIGGDEFLLIATELHNPEDSILIAEKVIKSLSQPVFVDEGKLMVGSSIGIALIPDHGNEAETLIKKADIAMYKVKKSGKNKFAISESVDRKD